MNKTIKICTATLVVISLLAVYRYAVKDVLVQQERKKDVLVLKEYLSQQTYVNFLTNEWISRGECYMPEQGYCAIIHFDAPADKCLGLEEQFRKELDERIKENTSQPEFIKFKDRIFSPGILLERNADGSCTVEFAVKKISTNFVGKILRNL